MPQRRPRTGPSGPHDLEHLLDVGTQVDVAGALHAEIEGDHRLAMWAGGRLQMVLRCIGRWVTCTRARTCKRKYR